VGNRQSLLTPVVEGAVSQAGERRGTSGMLTKVVVGLFHGQRWPSTEGSR
jgi:hypothetical protein